MGAEPGNEEFRLGNRVVAEEYDLVEGKVPDRLGQGAEADGLALGYGPKVGTTDP